MLANIPDGGNASFFAAGFDYTMTSGSLTVGSARSIYLSHGYGLTLSTAGILADYFDENWTFDETENVSTMGTSATPCTQPYVAEFAGQPGYCEGYGILPLPINSSDLTEPHVWNGTPSNWFGGAPGRPGCLNPTPGASVRFDTSFHGSGSGVASAARLDLCNQSGTHSLEVAVPAEVPVVMSVPHHGGSVSATGYLTWAAAPNPSSPGFATAAYALPPGWLWDLAPVGPVTSPIDPQGSNLPGLVAFERTACPG